MNGTFRSLVLAALGLAACTRSTDFDVTSTFDPVNSTGGTGYSLVAHVDLASQAGSAWDHRDKIQGLELVGLDGTMTANHSGVATTGNGSIVLSRKGATRTAGTWPTEPIPATGRHSIGVTLDAGAVSLIEDAIRDDGMFDVTLAGSTAATVSFAADVTLHLTMKYKVP